MSRLTVSPGAASPPTSPLTSIEAPDSAALMTSSAVIGSTEIVALADRSTLWVEVVVALNGLPATSLPLTLASSVVSFARSLPGTAIEKLLPAPTVPV